MIRVRVANRHIYVTISGILPSTEVQEWLDFHKLTARVSMDSFLNENGFGIAFYLDLPTPESAMLFKLTFADELIRD